MSKEKKDILAEKPKVKLNFNKIMDITLKPVTNIDANIGRIFLYPLTLHAIESYANNVEVVAIARIRNFLSIISSLSSDRKEGKLTFDQVAQLSDEEIELISEAYALSNQFQQVKESEENELALVRNKNENNIEFLDRLLKGEVEKTQKQAKLMHEKVLSSTQGIFDQVRKSSSELGQSWQQFEQLKKAAFQHPPEFDLKPLSIDNRLTEHTKILAKERAQDREMNHLTGQMTVQSAKTLQELAEAAATLLERLDQRDKEAKHTTKIQLWFAVGSLFISTLFAGASVYQDYRNNKSGDQWQATVLDEFHQLNLQEKYKDREMRVVREENQKLENRVQFLESQLKEEKKIHH